MRATLNTSQSLDDDLTLRNHVSEEQYFFLEYAFEEVFIHLQLAHEGKAITLASLCEFPVEAWIKSRNAVAHWLEPYF